MNDDASLCFPLLEEYSFLRLNQTHIFNNVHISFHLRRDLCRPSVQRRIFRYASLTKTVPTFLPVSSGTVFMQKPSTRTMCSCFFSPAAALGVPLRGYDSQVNEIKVKFFMMTPVYTANKRKLQFLFFALCGIRWSVVFPAIYLEDL
jgi:hypothetical protein